MCDNALATPLSSSQHLNDCATPALHKSRHVLLDWGSQHIPNSFVYESGDAVGRDKPSQQLDLILRYELFEPVHYAPERCVQERHKWWHPGRLDQTVQVVACMRRLEYGIFKIKSDFPCRECHVGY